ncbi:hypothetical protein [Actinoplanes auranticolor]|nr:hypothetical protein [Actinoplanes auranticolor]
MAVKHRKMGRKKGDTALSTLNEDLRETLALIKEEAAFEADLEGSPRTTAEMAEKFPAVAGQQRMT